MANQVNPINPNLPLDQIVNLLDQTEPSSFSSLDYIISKHCLKTIARCTVVAGIVLAPGLIKRFVTHSLAPQVGVIQDLVSIAKYSTKFYGTLIGGGIFGTSTVLVTEAILFDALINAAKNDYENAKIAYEHWRIDVRAVLEKNLMIPEQFHNDPIFSENLCPITLRPIRIPVKDRRNPKHIYERSAIRAWLNIKATSPYTNLPLSENDLILDEETYQTIRNRLQELNVELPAEEN